jgi:hypothetical protein
VHPRLSTKRGRLKGIPYEPEDRGDGNPNIGFRPLKGRPQDSNSIPEARNEPALLYALTRLNEVCVPFFTSGCEKAYNLRGVQARPIGYVEFVHNSIAASRAEDYYWELARELEQAMTETRYELPVEFEYIVSPTRFNDHGFDGFSAATYVRSCGYLQYRVARRLWRQAVHYLTDFLCARPQATPPLFYGT